MDDTGVSAAEPTETNTGFPTELKPPSPTDEYLILARYSASCTPRTMVNESPYGKRGSSLHEEEVRVEDIREKFKYLENVERSTFEHLINPSTDVGGMVIRLLLMLMNVPLVIAALEFLNTGLHFLTGKDASFHFMENNNAEFMKEMEGIAYSATIWGFIILGLGLVTGYLCLLGFAGGVLASSRMLRLYSAINVAFVTIELMLLTFVLLIPEFGKETLLKTLKNYEGYEGENQVSITWNKWMRKGYCCGVNNYNDFKDLERWPPKTLISNGFVVELEAPLACCKNYTPSVQDYTCAVHKHKHDRDNNRRYGCYKYISERLLKNTTVYWNIGLLVMYQSIIAMCAFCIAKSIPEDALTAPRVPFKSIGLTPDLYKRRTMFKTTDKEEEKKVEEEKKDEEEKIDVQAKLLQDDT